MDKNELLAAAREEFLKIFSEHLDGVLEQSGERLFTAAEQSKNMAEQRLCLDARALLASQAPEVKTQMASAMERLLTRGFKTAYSSFRPSFSKAFKLDKKLSLIDAKAFEGELLVDELTARFRNAAEVPLRDLNTRIAVLFDQGTINERENPFRPFMFTRSIAAALEQLDLTKELVNVLTARLAEAMVEVVVRIYAQLNQLLDEQGVEASLPLIVIKLPDLDRTTVSEDEIDAKATTSIKPVKHPRSHKSASPAATAPSSRETHEQRVDLLFKTVQSQLADQLSLNQGLEDASTAVDASIARPQVQTGWLSNVKGVGQAIRGFFKGDDTGASTLEHDEFGPHADDFYQIPTSRQASARLLKSVDTLLRTQTPSVADLETDDHQFRNLILEARSTLNTMDLNANEQMTIDIVAMLFEFILKDLQVPAEIRAQLGRLQFLVLKLALKDPTLFTQAHHPARMLVNRIGSVSFALKKADPSGERIAAEICRMIEVLLNDGSESLELFSSVLDEFEAFIASELRGAEADVAATIAAVEDAETRSLRHQKIVLIITEALAGLTLDPLLSDFLVQTWSRVLERAYHEHNQRADAFRDLMGEIIWSIAPKPSNKERSSLLKMIPRLLETLQAGLQLSDWKGAQRQIFLNWLINAHSLALRASSVPMPVPPIADLKAPFARIPGGNITRPVVASRELQESIDSQYFHELIREIEESLSSAAELLVEESPAPAISTVETAILAPAPIAAKIDDHTQEAHALESLKCGVAIEVRLDSEPSRAKLNWISTSTSTLAMTIEGRTRPVVISIKTFQRLLTNGRARFLESSLLFERAIERLFESADQLDAA